MKQLSKIVSVLALLSATGVAEDPLLLGIRGAISILAPVSEAASYSARTTAAEMLARCVKQRDGNFLVQSVTGSTGIWVECRDLRLTRVTGQAVSSADRANGIAESYLVSVDTEIYRTSVPATGGWTQWYNGTSPLMPSALRIELTTAGNWVARIDAYFRLRQFSGHGDPNVIPHGPQPSASTQSSSSGNPIVFQPRKPAPAPSSPAPTSSDASSAAVGFVSVIIVGMIAAALISAGAKHRKRRGVVRQHVKRPVSQTIIRPTTPPPLLPDAPRSTAPPSLPSPPSTLQYAPPSLLRYAPPSTPPVTRQFALPSAPLPPPPDPMDLIQLSENLLTPAELAFFAALEPHIHSSHRISAKVRLADLFNAVQGPGQQTAFNKIVGKHIDFVITDAATSRILCGIELDDRSHNRPDRIERDRFVNELFARHSRPLLRVPFAWTYYPQALRAELAKVGLAVAAA